MYRVILALLVVSASGVDIDETLSLLQVHAAVTDEAQDEIVEISETSCPDLGGFYTTDWYRTIDVNMNAGNAWYHSLPGNWWYGMSGDQAKKAILTRCCPSLGGKTAAQWAATIDGNTAAGRAWYHGLPEKWWYGMTGEEAKNVIASQCPVKSEAECSAQGGNQYNFCGGLNYCCGACSGQRHCGSSSGNCACFGQAATPSPTPAPTATTTTTTVVSLDGLDEEEREDEIEDEQVRLRECKGWCRSDKHNDRAWTGDRGKCNWFACTTCPECSA